MSKTWICYVFRCCARFLEQRMQQQCRTQRQNWWWHTMATGISSIKTVFRVKTRFAVNGNNFQPETIYISVSGKFASLPRIEFLLGSRYATIMLGSDVSLIHADIWHDSFSFAMLAAIFAAAVRYVVSQISLSRSPTALCYSRNLIKAFSLFLRQVTYLLPIQLSFVCAMFCKRVQNLNSIKLRPISSYMLHAKYIRKMTTGDENKSKLSSRCY